MLPGLRFLFAAILLSMSVLVFGLGAAALLRTAHEAFASNPSWRAAPEVMFAQPSEATKPVLAMLRFEPPAAPQQEQIPDDGPPLAAPAELGTAAGAEPGPSASTPAGLESIAPPRAEDSLPQETAKPETAVTESQSQSESAQGQADAPAAAEETRIAASEQILSMANEATPAAPEQMSPTILAEVDVTSTRIAKLGARSVTIKTPRPAKMTKAKPDRSIIRKRLQARRVAQHRRIAQRARLARQTLPQPVDLFAPPTIAVRNR